MKSDLALELGIGALIYTTLLNNCLAGLVPRMRGPIAIHDPAFIPTLAPSAGSCFFEITVLPMLTIFSWTWSSQRGALFGNDKYLKLDPGKWDGWEEIRGDHSGPRTSSTSPRIPRRCGPRLK